MLTDTTLVVQSAISSFNNAAIAAPTFFWSAVLMLPLFALVYLFGNNFIAQFGWKYLSDPKKRTFNFALFFEIVIIFWLVIMHGNYAVLRDNVSWLPFVIAAVLFVVTASVMQKLREINPPMPIMWQKLKRKKLVGWTLGALVLALVGFSGVPTWWGFLMQSAAVLCGAIVGYRMRRGIGHILMTSVTMFVLTTIVLMQPEFFRFGQLGDLTAVHLFFVLLTGALVMAIIALRNINPRGRIHHSAFVKLKWMARIVAGLALILFVLTESVPVFLGLCAVTFAMFAMSIWHSTAVAENLSKKLWAVLLCVFGVMTSLPIITAFGILYWTSLPKLDVWKQAKHLL